VRSAAACQRLFARKSAVLRGTEAQVRAAFMFIVLSYAACLRRYAAQRCGKSSEFSYAAAAMRPAAAIARERYDATRHTADMPAGELRAVCAAARGRMRQARVQASGKVPRERRNAEQCLTKNAVFATRPTSASFAREPCSREL